LQRHGRGKQHLCFAPLLPAPPFSLSPSLPSFSPSPFYHSTPRLPLSQFVSREWKGRPHLFVLDPIQPPLFPAFLLSLQTMSKDELNEAMDYLDRDDSGKIEKVGLIDTRGGLQSERKYGGMEWMIPSVCTNAYHPPTLPPPALTPVYPRPNSALGGCRHGDRRVSAFSGVFGKKGDKDGQELWGRIDQ
jgi:hypothetical protein